MPKPTREQVMAELAKLPPEQHSAFLAEVERRLAEPDDGRTPTRAEAVGSLAGLAGAETIGEQPWYTRNLGPLPSVTQTMAALPEIGGFVGGVLGGGGLAATGPGVAIGAMKGAAIGGAGGEAFRQLGFRALGGDPGVQTPYDATRRIMLEGGKQAAMEGVGQGIGAVVGRVAKPFAGEIDRPVADAAERLNRTAVAQGQAGVEMPAGAVSSSRWVPLADTVAGTGPLGGGVGRRYRGAALQLTALADHAVARASKATTDTARGEAIDKGFTAFKQAFRKQTQKLYEDVAADLPGTSLEFPRTADLLEGVVARKQSAGEAIATTALEDFPFYRQTAEKFLDPATGKLKPKSLVDIKNAILELDEKIDWAHGDPILARNEAQLRQLRSTLKSEFLEHLDALDPAVAANLRAADKLYQEGAAKIQSVFGDNINKLASAGQYDKIVESVAKRSMSVDDIPRILEVVGPEGADAMRAGVMADLIAKATKRGSTPAERAMTPKALANAMQDFGMDKLKALLKPDQFQHLSDVATASNALEKGSRVMAGSQTMPLTRLRDLVTTGPMAIGYAATGNPALLAGLVGDAAFQRFVATPTGQRWLTTGLALRPGTRVTLQNMPRSISAAMNMSQQAARDRRRQEE